MLNVAFTERDLYNIAARALDWRESDLWEAAGARYFLKYRSRWADAPCCKRRRSACYHVQHENACMLDFAAQIDSGRMRALVVEVLAEQGRTFPLCRGLDFAPDGSTVRICDCPPGDADCALVEEARYVDPIWAWEMA